MVLGTGVQISEADAPNRKASFTMIQEFVDAFMAKKPQLKAMFAKAHPGEYMDIVKSVVEVISDDDYDVPDPGRIHQIDDGEYQGTLVFVIGAKGYQPSKYWYVYVDYGSCSGCDTLQAIHEYSDEPPNEGQINDYMTLALHIVQGIKEMV